MVIRGAFTDRQTLADLLAFQFLASERSHLPTRPGQRFKRGRRGVDLVRPLIVSNNACDAIGGQQAVELDLA